MLATTWKAKIAAPKTLGLKILVKSFRAPATNILRKASEGSDNLEYLLKIYESHKECV